MAEGERWGEGETGSSSLVIGVVSKRKTMGVAEQSDGGSASLLKALWPRVTRHSNTRVRAADSDSSFSSC